MDLLTDAADEVSISDETSISTQLAEEISPEPPRRRRSPTTSSTSPPVPSRPSMPTLPHPLGKQAKAAVHVPAAKGGGGGAGPSSAAPATAPPTAPPTVPPSELPSIPVTALPTPGQVDASLTLHQNNDGAR